MDQDEERHEQPQITGNDVITVDVCDPKVIEGITKFILYTVKGSDNRGEFEVNRRFNDFQTLRAIMVQKWPGCYIPPLPPKKAIGNMDQKFIDDRRFYLDRFCQRIATMKYLWYSEEFQVFIRSVQGDIEKQLTALQKTSNEEIINRYTDTFTELSGKEINNQISSKIQEFSLYLKKVIPMIDNFKRIAKNISEAKRGNQDQLGLAINSLLPDYEKNILHEYGNQDDQKHIISNTTNNEAQEKLALEYKEILAKDEFVGLYEAIRQEQKELEAFQETFVQREKYENQRIAAEQKQKELQIELQSVLAGKTSLKSIFSKTNKEDAIQKLQTQIDQSNKDIQTLQFICDILTVLLGYNEIDRFKLEKQHQYYALIKRVVSYEVQLAKATQDYWEKVQSNYFLI